jgi:hypothetical protein
METVKIKTEVTITQEKIEDLLCGAFEGGSTYWAYYKVSKKDKETVGAEYSFEVATRGGSIDIYDVENGELLGVLNEDSIKKGLQLMADKYSNHFKNIINNNDDAETADVLMQLSVIGKITFG